MIAALHARTATLLSLVLCATLTLGAACDNDQTRNDQSDAITDDTSPDSDSTSQTCHAFGDPFAPPDGVTDPWRLINDIATYCCSDQAQSIVIASTPANGQCNRSDPLRFVCVHETGDDVCSPEENFCTSPLDCQPPNDSYPLCCHEGVECGTGPDDETGVDGCCNGLELVPFSLPNRQGDCLTAPAGGLCVENCGDGECTLAENRCNCPEDCE